VVSTVTFARLYALAREKLPSAFEAEQLFCHVTGWRRHDLPHMGGQAAPKELVRRLEDLCRRRSEGEPLQYLLEEWEFYGLPFHVGEGVLIPRADTETLVDAALACAEGCGEPRILDLCSGSGAVAVALAHRLPSAHVTAVELSEGACAYLEKNIRRNGVPVRMVQADIFAYEPDGAVDILTANPPYIPSAELDTLQEEVRREPGMALDGGADGLRFYRGIAGRFCPHLREGGAVCLEIGMGQEEAVAEILQRAGCREIGQHRDLGGIIRVVTARKPHGNL